MKDERKRLDSLIIAKVMMLMLTGIIIIFIVHFSNYGFGSVPFAPSRPVGELVNDKYNELRKVLKAASTRDKTVILAFLNKAWAAPNSIFDLFLESFRIGNNTEWLLNHLLVVGVDDDAYIRCQTSVPHCYFLDTVQSSELASQATFMTPSYLDMIWTRLSFCHTILSLGYNFLVTDTDVLWFRNPFPHFVPDCDIQTSCDYFYTREYDLNNLLNVGFMLVRSNNRTTEFYKFWISSRQRYPNLHEQDVFNELKYDPYFKEVGLRVRFLSTRHFSGFCYQEGDFENVYTMHANCCIGLYNKITDLKITLQDWKMYVDSNPRAKNLRTSRWRAPYKCLPQ